MKKLLVALAFLGLGLLSADGQVRCTDGNVPLCRGNNVTSFDSIDLESFGRPRLSTTLNVYINPVTCGGGGSPPQPPNCGVDTAVSFTENGCTITNPCLTIERGFQEVEKYDLADFPARINLANGTYNYTTRVTQGPVGAGGIVVTGPIDGSGNCINRDLVLIRPPAGTGHGFGIAIQGREVTIQCMNISTAITPATGAQNIAFHGGVIGIVKDVTFGTSEAGNVSCAEGARCQFTGDYSITGYNAYHLRVAEQALVFHIARTITFATPTSFNVTNITQANPAVVTAAGHNFVNGNIIKLKNVGGMTEVNGQTYTVANATATTFELANINSTGFGAYTSGGTTHRPYNYSTGFVNVERGGGMSLTSNIYVPQDEAQTTVTFTSASPGVVTWTNHGRSPNDALIFSVTGGSLPPQLTRGIIYYVRNVLDANTFTISTLPNGSEINTSSTGSGTITAALRPDITGRKFYVASGGWITPGFVPNVVPSVPQELPGTGGGQVDSGGIYFSSGNVIGPVTTMTRSATLSIGLSPNLEIRVTGSTGPISSFGTIVDDSAIGMYRFLNFDSSMIIFNNNPIDKSYILTPDGRNMNVSPGDRVFAVYIGGNVWRAYWLSKAQLPSGQNYFVNPSFDVWQAGTSFVPTTPVFVADRWRANRGAVGSTVSRGAGIDGAEFSLQIQRDAGNAVTSGVNIAQQLESRMARQLRGQTVVFSCLYETGADYSPTTPPASFIYTGTGANEAFSFAIPGFTTGNTVSGNLTASVLPTIVAGQTGTFTSDTYLVPSTTGGSPVIQMAVRIVTAYPAVAAGANDWIRFTNCKLEAGPAVTPFNPVPKAQVLDEVMRRYQKSFLEATAPAQNVGVGTGEFRAGATMTGATAGTMGTVQFAQQMALTATGALPTCTLYNPAAANAQVRNITDGADLSASAAANIGQMGFEIQTTGSAGTAVGETLGVHWTCDSRM